MVLPDNVEICYDGDGSCVHVGKICRRRPMGGVELLGLSLLDQDCLYSIAFHFLEMT